MSPKKISRPTCEVNYLPCWQSFLIDFYFPHPHKTLCYETEDDHTVEWVLKRSVHLVTFIMLPNMFEIRSDLRGEKKEDKKLEKQVTQFLKLFALFFNVRSYGFQVFFILIFMKLFLQVRYNSSYFILCCFILRFIFLSLREGFNI